MTVKEITEAFELLRKTCDPRGHAVLRALENLCIVEHVALEGLIAATKSPDAIVTRIDNYSKKA